MQPTHHTMDPHTNLIGTTTGMLFGLITPQPSIQNTIIFATIGAIVGFLVTQLCKWIWKKVVR